MRRVVADLAERIERLTNDAAAGLDRAVRAAADEKDGSLARGIRDQMNRLRTDLDGLLAAESGPIRVAADRFMEGLATELRRTATQDSQRMASALSLDVAGSPLSRLRDEVRNNAERTQREMTQALTELRLSLEVEKARSHTLEQASGKGLVYEDLVCDAVETIAHGLGDQLEATGAAAGLIAGCKIGDAVTTVAERTAPGRVIRIVIEAKDATLSASKWAQELDRARANRGAVAALAVVNGREHMPGRRAVHIIDPLRVIVCHDKDGPPDLLLAAYHLLRVQAVRSAQADSHKDLDATAVNEEIAQALEAVDGFDSLDRAISQTNKSMTTLANASERLRKALTNHLTRASALLESSSSPPAGRTEAAHTGGAGATICEAT